MTLEERETKDAARVVAEAARITSYHAAPDDLYATTIAILVRALELATPELSPAGRARLFFREE